MKAALPSNQIPLQKVMTAIYVWLRITLSYCVVGAVITTLLSAGIQHVNVFIVTVIMATFLGIGVYKAEVARRGVGLNNYLNKLSEYKHHQF